MSVFLAYDGSTGNDWVSHYAIRLAARDPSQRLVLVHVPEGHPGEDELNAKVARIRRECEAASVDCSLVRHRVAKSVAATLLQAIPAGSDTYLVCGLRVRPGQRGLLSGTVSERLLRSAACNVLAVRVVQPGLLGLPRRILVPVSPHRLRFELALPLLRLLRPDIVHLHLFYVQRIGLWRLGMLSHETVERFRQLGEGFCSSVEQEVLDRLAFGPHDVDSHVVVSNDLAREIVLAANKTKSRLVLMGASERRLAERLVSSSPVDAVLATSTCDVAIYQGRAS